MAVLLSQFAQMFVHDGDTPGTYIKINNFSSFNGPDGDTPTIDISNLDSVRREFAPGLPDEGNFTMELQRDPADPGQAELETMRDQHLTRNFRLVLNSGHFLSFDAFVTSLTSAGGVDEVLTGQATLKITGTATWQDPE
jgi:hypothetical protein